MHYLVSIFKKKKKKKEKKVIDNKQLNEKYNTQYPHKRHF